MNSILCTYCFASALISLHPSRQGQWRPLRYDEAEVHSFAFSPNDRNFISMTSGRMYRLWDVASGKERKKVRLSFGKKEWPKRIIYNRNGDLLILLYRYLGFRFEPATGVRTQGTIACCLWNMKTGKKSPFVTIGYGGVAVCPKGKFLAYDDGLWEIATGKKVRKLASRDRSLIFEIKFSPDGNTLAYWYSDIANEASMIRLVDVTTGKRLSQIGHLDFENANYCFRGSAVFSQDGKRIAFTEHPAGRTRIHVRDIATNKEVHWKSGISESVVGFLPNRKTLITWDSNATIRLWHTANGQERRSIKIGPGVRSVTLSPDGNSMAMVKGKAIEFRKLPK